ncbi:MAG: NADH-quinone oxidoreductase subunit J [Acidobacteria bacterium]|nr:NADH-quinone oxidoreductase subunit J [Acidobacteriota bacterium]
MVIAFYIAGAVAIVATVMTITRVNAVHALLYLIVSLLAAAVIFFLMGAPAIAALEIVIYAGAIMVLFLFTVMMMNLGQRSAQRERELLTPGIWIGPLILGAVLLAEFGYVLMRGPSRGEMNAAIPPKAVGIALYGQYVIAVELASFLMLAALIGAFHLGWRRPGSAQEGLHVGSDGARADARSDLVHAGSDRVTRAS